MNSSSSQNQGNATPILDRGDAPAIIAKLAQQLAEASESFRNLERILRDPLAHFDEHEQSQSAANPFRERREIMNTSHSAMPTAPKREMIAAKEVAELLAIDARSFRRLRNTRNEKFPAAIRVGTAKRWRARDVQEWLDARRPE